LRRRYFYPCKGFGKEFILVASSFPERFFLIINFSEACQLLGTLRKADNKLLLQAMSKTLIGNVVKEDGGLDDRLFEESFEFFQVSLENWTQVIIWLISFHSSVVSSPLD
jgi:hypothetical protein